jgi:hypothetical protein
MAPIAPPAPLPESPVHTPTPVHMPAPVADFHPEPQPQPYAQPRPEPEVEVAASAVVAPPRPPLEPAEPGPLTQGWQPDPAIPGQQRWYDGTRWTNMTRPVPADPTLAHAGPTRPAAPAAWSGDGPPPWSPGRGIRPAYLDELAILAAPPRKSPVGKILAVLVVVLLIAGGVFVLNKDDGPSHPKKWDARVLDIVHFVEAERGDRFEHPIAIDFLSEADFKKEVGGSTDELSKEDREQLEQAAAAFRAVGMMSGSVDLRSAGKQLVEEGVIGLYDPESESIKVRGNNLTPSARVTLAHELTHALQDQRFDLRKLQDGAVSDNAVRSLFEADAVRIEDAYIDRLSETERAQYDQQSDAESDGANFEGIPEILTHMFAFPYVFGPGFVQALIADGGTAAVDAAFANPPRSEADILDPTRYLSHVALDKPAAPKLGAGEKMLGDKGDPDDFGQELLVEMLGVRISFDKAWKAVQGWRGDRSVLLQTKSGQVCVATNVKFDSDSSAAGFVEAAQPWSTAVSGTLTQTGATVAMRSCDPGTQGAAVPTPDPDPFTVLAVRSALLKEILQEPNTKPNVAVCAVNLIIDRAGAKTVTELDSLGEGDPRGAAFFRTAAQSAAECASRTA